jgi:hypothetical protein
LGRRGEGIEHQSGLMEEARASSSSLGRPRRCANLRMAESKSDQFSCEINAHSEKHAKFQLLSINRLSDGSECDRVALRPNSELDGNARHGLEIESTSRSMHLSLNLVKRWGGAIEIRNSFSIHFASMRRYRTSSSSRDRCGA